MNLPDAPKAMAAALLLLIPAGFGVATVLDDPVAPMPTANDAPEAPPAEDAPSSSPSSPSSTDGEAAAPPTYEGELVKRFQDSFDITIQTGSLDLRMDHGAVRVVAWDRNAYRIDVLREPTEGQEADDFETITEFDDASQGSHLDLTLTVTQDGTYGVGVQADDQGTQDPTPEIATVAYVPAAALYDEVHICSGHRFPMEDRWDDIDWWPFSDEEVKVDATCTGTDDSPGVSVSMLHANTNGSHDEELKVPFGVQGLDGQKLVAYAEFQDVDLQHAGFDQAAVLAKHGDVEGSHLAGGTNLTVMVEYGDITLEHVSNPNVQAWSGHGDVDLGLQPRASGTVDAFSEHGDLLVRFPTTREAGVQLTSGTDHGEIVVQLSNASVEQQENSSTDWRNPNHWTSWLQDDDAYRYTAKGETQGFATAPIQVQLKAFSEHGDVIVTDQTVVPDPGSEDDEG